MLLCLLFVHVSNSRPVVYKSQARIFKRPNREAKTVFPSDAEEEDCRELISQLSLTIMSCSATCILWVGLIARNGMRKMNQEGYKPKDWKNRKEALQAFSGISTTRQFSFLLLICIYELIC